MINKYQIDQGSIIYGINSAKYSSVPCYGIIITASCDIFNQKVSKYYYLLGIDVDSWLKSAHCVNYIFGKDIQKKLLEHKKIIEKARLDADILMQFNQDQIDIVLKEKAPTQIQKINESIIFIKKASAASTICDLDGIVDKPNKKILSKLKEISQGRETHYYYLPKAAYTNSDSMDCGLIIDLQEIGYFIPEEIEVIKNNRGIDFEVVNNLNNNDLKQTLSRHLFLESEESLVDVEGIICSPWREHLMQRFSQGFIRIGLDGATDSDFDSISRRVIGG